MFVGARDVRASVRVSCRTPRAGSRAALVVAVAMGVAIPASADPPERFALGWARSDDAASCPDARAVAAEVERRLGRSPWSDPARAEAIVEGVVRRTGDGYAVVLRLTTTNGTVLGARDLAVAAASCDALLTPASLAISLLIDPSAVIELGPVEIGPDPEHRDPAPELTRDGAAEPAGPELDPPACEPVAADASARVEAPDQPPGRLLVAARAGVGITLGRLPGPAFSLVTGIALWFPWGLSIELAATLHPALDATLPEGGGASVLSGLAGLGVCPEIFDVLPVRAGVCGMIEAGILQSRGHGFDRSYDAAGPLAEIGASAWARISLPGPFVVDVALMLSVPLVRNRLYALDDRGTERVLFEPSPVVVTLAITVGIGGR